MFSKAFGKASEYHSRVPGLKKLPFSAVAIIVILILVNALIWAAVGVVLVRDLQYSERLDLLLMLNSSVSTRQSTEKH